MVIATSYHFVDREIFNKDKKPFSQNEITPYIRKFHQKFNEARTFLVNYYQHATKGLLQEIENASCINKKTENNLPVQCDREQDSLGRQVKW